MKRIYDFLGPRGENLQVILRKSGVPVSGLYSDDRGEVRSPDLDKKRDDVRTDRNNQ